MVAPIVVELRIIHRKSLDSKRANHECREQNFRSLVMAKEYCLGSIRRYGGDNFPRRPRVSFFRRRECYLFERVAGLANPVIITASAKDFQADDGDFGNVPGERLATIDMQWAEIFPNEDYWPMAS